MGVGNSTLGGRPPRAWWDAWPQTTSASEQQRARLVDDFEGVEPEPEEPVPPVTVAEVHAFLEEWAAQRRGPHPDTLPQRWQATALQLWAHITQQVERVRQAPAPNRYIRSAPEDSGNNAERAQPAAAASRQSDPAGGGTGAASALPVPEPGRLQSRHTFPAQAAATATALPRRGVADALAEKLSRRSLAHQLDQLQPAFLSDYLREEVGVDIGEYAGCAPPLKALAALYEHLAPLGEFAGDPASVARLNATSREQLMRRLARELGWYGARAGERIAPAFERQLLTGLLTRSMNACIPTLGMPTLDEILSDAARDQRMLTEIRIEVSNHLQTAARLQGGRLPGNATAWLTDVLLADAEPALARAGTPGDLRYGSLEWADLQTGIDTAIAFGEDHWSMTYADLVALAQNSDIAARQYPATAAALLTPQVRAALVFAGMSIEPDDPKAGLRTLQALTALNDARTARWSAVQHKLDMLETLEAPMPTRSQLARKILRFHHIDPDVTYPTSAYARNRKNEMFIPGTALNLYLDGRGRFDGFEVPEDLDQEFDLAFTDYTSKYRLAIKTLFGDVVQALPEPDRSFWQQGQAQILVPDVALDLRDTPSLSQWPLRMRELTAIVAVSHNGKARHYLVSAAGNDTRPIRPIADDLPRDLDHADLRALDQALLPYANALFSNAGDMRQARHRVWNFRSAGEPGPATSVVAQHFTRPVEALREQAYKSTEKQLSREALKGILLSLIPFYDCATETRKSHTSARLISCVVDVVGLIPLLRAGISVGAGAGKLSINLGAAALRQLAANGVSRQTLLAVSAQMTAPLARYGKRGGKALAGVTAQWLDPGFTLLGNLPAAARRAFMSTLRRWPDLKPLAARIQASLMRQPYHFNTQAGVWQMRKRAVTHRDGRQFAQIGASEVEVIDMGTAKHVPVTRLDDSGDDVRFTLVDPRSGLPYGPQWVPTLRGIEELSDYRVRLKGALPAPDAQGIIHFEQSGYVHDVHFIHVGGEYFAVRYNEDWQTWRIHRTSNVIGHSIPVRYDARQGDWTMHSDGGLRGGSPVEQVSFEDIPDEMIARIAGYLPDVDIARIRQVNRHVHELLTQESQRIRLVAAALRVRRLQEFQALLGRPGEGIAVIRGLRASLQDGPLTALIGRIGGLPGGMTVLPEAERLAAFDLIHDAVAALSPQYRELPLAALADQIRHLPADRRQHEYQRIFSAISRLDPPYRVVPLAALGDQIGQLEDMQARSGAFDDLMRATLVLDRCRRAGPLMALITQVRHLPRPRRLSAFDRIFDAIRTLPMEPGAAPHAALAERIHWLPENQRQAAFNRVRREIVVLPLRYRAALLTALAGQFEFLPVPRLELFVTLTRSSVMAVPQHRADLLRMLAERIRFVAPPADRGRAWRSFLSQAETLPPQPRATAHAALARPIQSIPSMADRLESFNLLFHAIMRLPPQHRAAPLNSLAETISFLPVLERPDAFDRIRASLAAGPAE